MARSGTAKYPYQTDKGNRFFARTDDSVALDSIRGTEPTGETTENITFEFTKNAKEVGCRPRHVVLVRQVSIPGAPPCLVDTVDIGKKVIVLTQAHFNSLKTGKSGTQVTFGGQQYRVKTKVFEQMR